MNNENYPGLIERVKALVADSIMIILLMFLASYIFSTIQNVPDIYRIWAMVFIFGLYDPIFTSLFGGTIGHLIIGIRVKRESNESKNIIFPLALLRYSIKTFLGWISLITVMLKSNDKRMALHDFAAGSVVVYRKKSTTGKRS